MSDACPECGGTTGVQARATIRTIYHVGWDGDSEVVDYESGKAGFNKFGRCIDCGARVRVPYGWKKEAGDE